MLLYRICHTCITNEKILPANGYTPADFMDQPQPLQIVAGHTLAPPVPIAWDRPLHPTPTPTAGPLSTPPPDAAAASPQNLPAAHHPTGLRPRPMDLSLLLNPALFKPKS